MKLLLIRIKKLLGLTRNDADELARIEELAKQDRREEGAFNPRKLK